MSFGMSAETAFEVECALLEAYPGATNLVAGHGASDRGVAHVRQIIERFEARPIDVQHRLLAVNVSKTSGMPLYEAARFFWKLNAAKLPDIQYVLAVEKGIVLDVFKPLEWHRANDPVFSDRFDPVMHKGKENFFGFSGKTAAKDIHEHYLRSKLPKPPKGAQNPFRYLNPPNQENIGPEIG